MKIMIRQTAPWTATCARKHRMSPPGSHPYCPEEDLDWSRYAHSRLKDFRRKNGAPHRPPERVLVGPHGI